MQPDRTPTHIARETLKQLSLRKIAPTPDNYRRVYDEIAGVDSSDGPAALARVLVRVLRDAGGKRPKYLKAANEIASAADAGNWTEVERQLRELFPNAASASWATVVRTLVRQLETSHKGIPPGKKKEGLERVLVHFEHDPEQLAHKIQSLTASWSMAGPTERVLNSNTPLIEPAPPAVGEAVAPATSEMTLPGTDRGASAALWRDLLIRTLELGLLQQFQHEPPLAKAAGNLLDMARHAHTEKQLEKLTDAFRTFWLSLAMNDDAQLRLHDALLSLLRLLVDNMGELVMDDQWLSGQTAMIRDIISQPLDIQLLYDAQSSLKELLFKQGKLKHSLTEARDTLKQMAATFAARLAQLSENTGDFHGKVGDYLRQISATEDITELNVILDQLMADTRSMQLDALRAHEELKETRQKVDEAEQRVQQLTIELEQASELAHRDYLTGALNRRGMYDAFQREFSRTDRSGAPLCIALMDIDNFKQLNDALGHEAGDDALTYLARVTQSTLRPSDVLARYGGEEFVIILPETGEEEAVQVMMRVQRELTRNFFLHRNEKVLITFSAGVTQRLPGEVADAALKRADQALYQAKRAGRNRVLSAELPPI